MSGPIYAVIGDIHANLDSLSAVLGDARARGVTHYLCVGDVVGYNAAPADCLDLIRELKCVSVCGNHDHYCSFDDDLSGFHPLAADAVDWTRRQLSAEQQKYLADLKLVERVGNITLVHSTLDMPEMWGYVFENLEAEASFNYQVTSVCFFGHTHVPLAFEKGVEITGGVYTRLKLQIGRKYFINVGSVGQPRDGDPRAAYVTYNVEKREVELHRIPYDIAAAQKRIREAGLPDKLAERLGRGR
jgi:diadenosine tetraphosphatase ApaH/serine/threonine PP2A family protein phosphatase